MFLKYPIQRTIMKVPTHILTCYISKISAELGIKLPLSKICMYIRILPVYNFNTLHVKTLKENTTK